jgi:chain length determinant protein EpsF
MNPTQLLLVLRARWWIVAATLVAAVGGAAALSLLLPKKYTATATVVVDFKTPDVVTGALLPAFPGYLATQVDVIKNHRVALQVVRRLKFADSQAAREQFMQATDGRGAIEDWLADRLGSALKVEPGKESALIDISYEWTEPKFAAILATAFAQAYIDVNLQLKIDPARQSAAFFDEQIKTFAESLEKRKAALSEYQRAKGIVQTDDRLEIENARLTELNTQLVQAQSINFDLQSRRRQLEEFVAGGRDPGSLPEVFSNALIQGLKNQLVHAETKLLQLQGHIGRNHPDYDRAAAEVASLREKLAVEIKNVASGIDNQASVSQRRESELRAAVAAQKQRVLDFNRGRDDMAVLIRDVESAQRAYDMATQRQTQTRLEGQTTQTNVLLLNPAVEPIAHSSPKTLRNLLIATFMGIGLAFLVEALDARVRSERELRNALGFPVLGSLARAPAGRSRRAGAKLGPVVLGGQA